MVSKSEMWVFDSSCITQWLRDAARYIYISHDIIVIALCQSSSQLIILLNRVN